MEQEINEDEVLSDSQSISTTRPSSSNSLFDMPKVNTQSCRNRFNKRQSSNIDVNDLSQLTNKQLKDETPIKVLVFNGKCSQIFKSTLEDCVEDCILEFPGEHNSIYVSKCGQAMQVPFGCNRNSIVSLTEPVPSTRQSARSNRPRNSANQYNVLPQTGSARNSLSNNFSLPGTTLSVTPAARMRHQLIKQRSSLVKGISEESTDQQTSIIKNIESGGQSKRPSILNDELISPNPNLNGLSASLPAFNYYLIPSGKTPMSYHDRQKDYRLSDLVTFGPEYFAHIFNLPRNHSISRRRESKTKENLTELDRIKQDLFHRYLWTKKPQVSCRIRPMSTYTRSSTFVI